MQGHLSLKQVFLISLPLPLAVTDTEPLVMVRAERGQLSEAYGTQRGYKWEVEKGSRDD
jgi:hypothetical protein